jgi:hypothetical protein
MSRCCLLSGITLVALLVQSVIGAAPLEAGVKVTGTVFVQGKAKQPVGGAAVHLRDLPKGWDGRPSKEPIVLVFRKGRLTPEFACIQTGQQLLVRAVKGERFLLRAQSRARGYFGTLLPPASGDFKDYFPKPDDFVSVTCAWNAAAKAHLQVVATPIFVLCDGQGRFVLPKRLPKGRHVLKAFFPGAGWAEKAITLRGDEGSVAVDLELKPRRKSPVTAAIEKVKPALVFIAEGGKKDKGEGKQAKRALGIIIDTKGMVVTNQSLIAGWKKVEVVLADGRRLHGKVVLSEVDLDLAVIQVEAGKALPHVEIGDSDKLKEGDRVVALSAPWMAGLDQPLMANAGLIGRKVSGKSGLLAVETSTGPGCGPGPLISMEGRLVGLVVGRNAAPRGVNAALPAKRVKERAKEGAGKR